MTRLPLRLSGPALAAAVGALFLQGCAEPEGPRPPATRVEVVVDEIHGRQVADPYRWLEDDHAPEVRRWIHAQNAYAEEVVDETPLRDSLRARLRALYDTPDVGSPREAGEYEYFTLRRKGEERERIVRRPVPANGEDGGGEDPDPDGEYEVVIDPLDLDSSGRTSVSILDLSRDGHHMLYSVRDGGADEISVRVLDTETLEDLPDSLPNALYGGVGFDADGSGFHYTHRNRTEGPRIRHHVLDTPVSEDELIFGEGYGPTAFLEMDVVEDGRYRIFTANHGWARNDVLLQEEGEAVQPVAVGIPAHFDTRWHDGRLWMRTDLDAPLYRIVTVDPDDPRQEAWEEVIPEGDAVLRRFDFIGGRIFATYLRNVADDIRIFGMDGSPEGRLEVPPHRSADVSGGDEEGTVELAAEGYLRPEVTWAVDLATGAREIVDTADVVFDTTGTVVEQVWHTSRDGTRVPMYVLRRADTPLDGTAPTILNGYGGFNAAITPGFSGTRGLWVQLGGIYAVTTLRGGSEFGEEWHRAGKLENKQNVFDDFISAAEWLVANSYTSPEHLGIAGGSNGGLLVGSAMTQRPDLFRAVLCTYPDLDMVRFPHYEHANNKPALLEYGDATDPEQFEFLLAYSPYQAVEDGVEYPAVMFTTGDLDTRVPPAQARKMAARVQAATRSGLPVILSYDEKGGHAAGRGRPLSLRVEATAMEYAFMMEQLGLTEWVSSASEGSTTGGSPGEG